jgi:hypothetical protein
MSIPCTLDFYGLVSHFLNDVSHFSGPYSELGDPLGQGENKFYYVNCHLADCLLADCRNT